VDRSQGLLSLSDTRFAPENCQSFQLVKSLYSIGHGEYAGTGLGKGTFTTVDGKTIIPDFKHRLHLLGAGTGARLIGAAAFYWST